MAYIVCSVDGRIEAVAATATEVVAAAGTDDVSAYRCNLSLDHAASLIGTEIDSDTITAECVLLSDDSIVELSWR